MARRNIFRYSLLIQANASLLLLLLLLLCSLQCYDAAAAAAAAAVPISGVASQCGLLVEERVPRQSSNILRWCTHIP